MSFVSSFCWGYALYFYEWYSSCFGLFWYPINNIPHNILTGSVRYRQYVNRVFLKSSASDTWQKKCIKWVITPSSYNVQTKPLLCSSNFPGVILHVIPVALVQDGKGMEILGFFDYMIWGKLMWHRWSELKSMGSADGLFHCSSLTCPAAGDTFLGPEQTFPLPLIEKGKAFAKEICTQEKKKIKFVKLSSHWEQLWFKCKPYF